MSRFKPSNLKKFFTAKAKITCLNSEFLLNGSLGKADLFLTSKDGWFNIFLNKQKERLCLEEGVKLFSNQKSYESYFEQFKLYLEKANKEIIPKYFKPTAAMTEQEFKKDVEFIGKLWYYYGFTEFPYIELAYKTAVKDKNEQMLGNLLEISQFKFKAREVMNAYFFKQGVIENLLSYISHKFLNGNDASYLYFDELIGLFHGEKPDPKVILERGKCYAAAIVHGKIERFPFQEALELNKLFTEVARVSELKGVTASPGKARGRIIICPLLDDPKVISAIDKK